MCMKKFIVSLVIVFVIGMMSAQVSGEEEAPKYRVEVTIVYNAQSARGASKKIQNIMLNHEMACSIEFDVRRADNNEGCLVTIPTID